MVRGAGSRHALQSYPGLWSLATIPHSAAGVNSMPVREMDKLSFARLWPRAVHRRRATKRSAALVFAARGATIKIMLAPQFSLRRLLAWVTVSAFLCLIVAAAARGQLWAAGVLVGLAGLVVVLAVHGLLFVGIRLVGKVRDRGVRRWEQSAAQLEPRL